MHFLKKQINKFIHVYRTLLNIITDVSTKTAVYESILAFLILLVLSLAFLDIFIIDSLQFSRFVELFDLLICIIFSIDLYIRYKHMSDKKTFFKKSWIEMLSIIPFDVVFRVFRVVRLFRVLRITRVSRAGRFMNSFVKVFRNVERIPLLAKTFNPQYLRYKRFKKLLFGYGKSKAEDSDS